MTFPFEEYERRLHQLRERMQERQLDVVLISDPENLMYLTDYQTTGYSFFQCLVIPIDDEPCMMTRYMEESNVIHRTWVERTRTFADTENPVQCLIATLKELGLMNKRLGYERNSYFFPAYQQDAVHLGFQDGTLVDCFGIVEEGRLTKSPAEIELMKRAAHATEAGMQAGYEACRAGVTENEIGGAISAGMFNAGGEPPSVMPYVTSGPRSMIGHATWEGREVQPGEHVFLEIGGCIRRYHTAMMRTVVLDELGRSMHQAQERMKLALQASYPAFMPASVAFAARFINSISAGDLLSRPSSTIPKQSINVPSPKPRCTASCW